MTLFVGLAVIVDGSGVTCNEQLFYVFNVFARFFEECDTIFELFASFWSDFRVLQRKILKKNAAALLIFQWVPNVL